MDADDEIRHRMTFDCSERLRRAIWYRAIDSGTTSPSETIRAILEAELADELKRADEAIAKGQPLQKSKRGRKPSP